MTHYNARCQWCGTAFDAADPHDDFCSENCELNFREQSDFDADEADINTWEDWRDECSPETFV